METTSILAELDTKKREISSFGWVEFDTSACVEVNYLKKFLELNQDANISYKKMDIPICNPKLESEGTGSYFDISSLENRLNRWGRLDMPKKKKKKQDEDDYDVNDSFIDDDEPVMTKKNQNVGIFESVLDDFVTVKGGLAEFRASEYYQNRMASVKATPIEEPKNKKKKITTKKDGKNSQENSDSKESKKEKGDSSNKKNKRDSQDSTKAVRRKRTEQPDMINKRNSEELKKQKMTTPEKSGSGLAPESQLIINPALNSEESKPSQSSSEVKAFVNDI